MAAHPDILDERERWGGPLAESMVLHAIVFMSIAAYGLAGGDRIRFGDPNSQGGGSVGIVVVNRLPLPSRGGRINPVANDTESRVPQPPKEAVARVREPDPDAISIKGRKLAKNQSDVAASRQRYRASDTKPNQLYSSTGQAASSPMIGITGTGGVNSAPGNPFGARFGYYEQLLRQRVAEKWRTTDIDPGIRSAPVAIVTFSIMRDGTFRNVRVVQSSGNYAVDNSAQRAIIETSPFLPLPQGFDRDTAHVEYWFEFKR